jgi:phosphoenolpyruvate synthase/pyruvate phosphate dikinase
LGCFSREEIIYMKKPQEYKQLMNRTMFLLCCQAWDIGERLGLLKASHGVIFFDPLFYHEKGKGISVFYNFTDPKQDLVKLISHFNSNKNEIYSLKKEFDLNCNKIRKIIKKESPGDLNVLFGLISKVFPFVTISKVLGDDARCNVSGVSKDLVGEFIKTRKESDDVLYDSEERMLELARQIVPKDHHEWLEFMTLEEINSREFSKEELKKRREKYIYHKGELYTDISLKDYADKNNYILIEESCAQNIIDKGDDICGTIAYKGKARGMVKIVLDRADVEKLCDGDILVTPMTTPNLISAMKKAVAFVTDEGGITCHAAIVARELKKPCIIGTKIATKVLKDGDLVEVDAENGVVKILKKKSNNE